MPAPDPSPHPPVPPASPAAPRPRSPEPHRDRKRVAPIPAPFDQVTTRFNAGDFRACVEPLEVLFFADRNTFYQGLLHLVVALLQTRLGMVRGPRLRLASAAELLAPYAPWHRGIDVSSLLAFVDACRQRLPEGVVQVTPEGVEQLGLPSHHLELTNRPDGPVRRTRKSPGQRPRLNARS